MPKFSIIIPTYENVELLQRSLKSVIIQDVADWEVIISDDSGTNMIKSYVESLNDVRIKYIKHYKRNTAVDNWNFGIQVAKGDYIILMHHDEAFIEPVHLQYIAHAFEAGAQVVISNIEIEKGKKLSKGKPLWLKKLALRKPSILLLCNTIGPTACISFRRERSQVIDSRLTWLVDVEWYYRMLKDSTITFLENLPIRSIHGHQGQLSIEINAQKAFIRDQAIINKKYNSDFYVKWMTFLYGWLIIRTKKWLCKL